MTRKMAVKATVDVLTIGSLAYVTQSVANICFVLPKEE
jgi:hypothetical protein